MLFKVTDDKVVALAGLCQAAALVAEIAEKDQLDEAALVSSVRSILNIDVVNVVEVYDGPQNLTLGFEHLQKLLSGLSGLTAQSQIRYMMSMDQLANRLTSARHTQSLVGTGIEEIKTMHSTTLATDESGEFDQWELQDLYQQLGMLYQKSLSLLAPRIIVKGAKGTLSSQQNVAKLRSALFAGVRAAYLWHQLGGRRWHLLFQRPAYRQRIEQWLK